MITLPSSPKRQTAVEFLEQAYLPRNPQVSAATTVQYACACRGFDDWSGGVISIQKMTVQNLSVYLQAVKSTGRSERTVNNRRQVMLTLWRFAYEDGLKSEPPPSKRRLPKLREPRRQPNAFTLRQMNTLRKACLDAQVLPRFDDPLWTGKHWWALCSLIWDTGHRVSALLNVPRSGLGFEGHLTVPAELTKNKVETVHKLKRSTVAVLKSLPAEDLLLKWPYNKRQLWVCFQRDVLVPSGLPFTSRHKFHCLRRTSASHLYAATSDIYLVMRHLGHRRVETTWGYVDLKIASKKPAAATVLPEITEESTGPAAKLLNWASRVVRPGNGRAAK